MILASDQNHRRFKDINSLTSRLRMYTDHAMSGNTSKLSTVSTGMAENNDGMSHMIVARGHEDIIIIPEVSKWPQKRLPY